MSGAITFVSLGHAQGIHLLFSVPNRNCTPAGCAAVANAICKFLDIFGQLCFNLNESIGLVVQVSSAVCFLIFYIIIILNQSGLCNLPYDFNQHIVSCNKELNGTE